MSMKHHENIRSESTERGYETRDAWPKALLIFGLALIGLVLIVMAISRGLLSSMDEAVSRGDSSPHPLAEERQVPHAPRLQVTPSLDIAEHREIERRLLTNYEWIDREEGVVRIPVSRAMELVVERGGSLR